MVRVVDCHAGVLGSNPGGPRIFSPWNYFTGGSGGIRERLSWPLGAVAGSPRLWLMPGSQEIKGEECSDSAIPNSLSVGLTL